MLDPFFPGWLDPAVNPFSFLGAIAENGNSPTQLNSSNRRVQCLNPAADYVVRLPNDVRAGEMVTIINRSTSFSVTVTASNATQIDLIAYGYIRCIALADNPTTPAGWLVVDVQEYGSWTPHNVGPIVTFDGPSGCTFARRNKMATLTYADTGGARAGASFAAPWTITGFPSRVAPASSWWFSTSIVNNSTNTAGMCVIGATELDVYGDNANNNWPSGAGVFRIRGFSAAYLTA